MAKKAKKPSRTASALEKRDVEQWPKRTVPLFRPKRAKYIRDLHKDEKKSDCVFCVALTKGMSEDSLVVHTTKDSMVILNKFPYNSGHLLVLPKQHGGDLQELNEDQYSDLTSLLKEAMSNISKVYDPAGMNVGLNIGKAAGAGIPEHLHFHIVPRWRGDLNFFSIIGNSKTHIEELSETYKKLKDAFQRSTK
jgi:ATP adenylyltransferase